MSRLIDADELINAIADFPYGYRGMIKNVIAEQPTVEERKGKWIPCSERLPEKVFSEHANDFIYPTVIICDESGRVTAGFYGEYIDGGSYWYDMDSETEISNIVAWCPLPECYKGE